MTRGERNNETQVGPSLLRSIQALQSGENASRPRGSKARPCRRSSEQARQPWTTWGVLAQARRAGLGERKEQPRPALCSVLQLWWRRLHIGAVQTYGASQVAARVQPVTRKHTCAHSRSTLFSSLFSFPVALSEL